MILWMHTQLKLKELFRQPVYWITSLIFPSMFFWFFALPHATSPGATHMLMGSFSAFAVLGVVFFQFGISLAQEKETPWSSFLQTLPKSEWRPLVAQMLTALIFSVVAVTGVILTTHVGAKIDLSQAQWLRFLAAVFLAGIPFAAGGALIGAACSARNAVPIGNLVYLPLSFAGGLWIPPTNLPKLIQDISEYLPTRMYAEIVWSQVLDQSLKKTNVYGLLAYGILAFVAAVYFRRRSSR